MTTDVNSSSDERVLRLNRHYQAPREIIFRAWTDPSWLVRWMGPQGCSIGGALKIAIRNSEGVDHWAHGKYQVIEAPARLSFTWQWEQEDRTLGHEMLIEIEFLDQNGETELVFTQTRFPTDESREQHEGGWTSAFESLADALDDLIQTGEGE